MLATHASSLATSPTVVKNLLGFKVLVDDDKFCEKAAKQLVKKLSKSNMLEDFERVLSAKDPGSKCITIKR
jgi:hypothetical protein